MIMLDEKSSLYATLFCLNDSRVYDMVCFCSAVQEVYPLLAGLGLGGLFFPPLIALQAAMPGKDMATSTATLGLLRQLGSTIGVSIGQAIWSSVSAGSSTLSMMLIGDAGAAQAYCAHPKL